jgi:alkaline phosphatase D
MAGGARGDGVYVHGGAGACALLLVAMAIFLSADPAGAEAEGRLLAAGPLLGYAGHQSVRIWVAPERTDAKLEVEVAEESPAAGEATTRRLIPFPAVPEGGRETQLRIDGLSPRTRYRYEVRVGGEASEATRGALSTGPLPGRPVRGTIAVVSCMNVKRWPTQPAWKAIAAEKPDLLLQIGDLIYANSTDPERIREWYRLQRNVPEYAPLIRTVPSLAIWDDHDFGANDGDGTLPGKERSLETFKALWPNPSFGLPDAPGVFHAESFGDVDLFMLDTRWYRAPNAAPDDERKDMLGEAQFRWLEEKVRASKATFKLVACGSTIYAGMKDCWRTYSRDRRRLLALTRDVPGIVFLTGDIHTALVARLEEPDGMGYPYYEIVSSGIAFNPSSFHYVTLAVDTTGEEKTLGVRVVRLDKEGKETRVDERVIRRSELVPGY